MSSILTNNSAMVALDTLRGINKNLSGVQSEISTGKKIATSTDNAAIWSIATVMESDVKSFDQVSDSLNLGSATVGVARSGAEAITERLQEAKALIVAANDPSVSDSDREKYQTDITELTASVQSIVDSASSNGQNLLKGAGSIDILSSLNRQSDGTVEAGKVNVERQNLSTSAAVAGDAVTTGNAGFVSESGFTLADGSGTATTDDFTIAAGNVAEDTLFSISIGDDTITYEAAAGTSAVDAGEGFAQAINDYLGGSDGTPPAGLTVAATDAAGVSTLTFTNTNATPVVVSDIASATNAEPEGGLYALSQIDVGTVAGAEAGLEAIDNLLQSAIDATAQFGSKQKRIDDQNEFVTTLKDSLKTGIGAMTDANLEEASARLQSLQVQQQLGVQALSIANQGPQQLLSLFR